MLGRSHRFHGYRALNGVYKNGRTVRSAFAGLRYGSRGQDKPYRVAVVVSKKTNKSAVIRNRIRRRVYAAIREASTAQGPAIRPGTDMVFTVFNDKVADMSPEELSEMIEGLLRKAAASPPGR